MIVSEFMVRDVVSVEPQTPLLDVARIIAERNVGAVPVVDRGRVVGVISESDMLRRRLGSDGAEREWIVRYLEMRADWTERAPSGAREAAFHARDVMTAPVLTVATTDTIDMALELMTRHHVKRLPVLRDDMLAGIVSRSDMLRVMSRLLSRTPQRRPNRARLTLRRPLLDRDARSAALMVQVDPLSEAEGAPSAEDFRRIIAASRAKKAQEAELARERAAEEAAKELNRMLADHVSEPEWKEMLKRARRAAERGERQCLVLRFPRQVCLDQGRLVEIGDHSWPETLRGKPAELYQRWNGVLRQGGFGMSAATIDYPGGFPGDIGLYLGWSG